MIPFHTLYRIPLKCTLILSSKLILRNPYTLMSAAFPAHLTLSDFSTISYKYISKAVKRSGHDLFRVIIWKFSLHKSSLLSSPDDDDTVHCKSDESSLHSHMHFRIHFNIIILSTLKSPRFFALGYEKCVKDSKNCQFDLNYYCWMEAQMGYTN
jgi:hypothetical protein